MRAMAQIVRFACLIFLVLFIAGCGSSTTKKTGAKPSSIIKKTGAKSSKTIKKTFAKSSRIKKASAKSASRIKKKGIKSSKNCDIRCVFEENPKWRRAAEKSATLWGTSVPVIMAIIYKESTFRQHARPFNKHKKTGKHIKKNCKRTRHNGNGKYLSSAYGYAQALKGTWDHYRKETGRKMARRDSFADCAHFIGWYSDQSFKRCGIKKNDAYSLYLAYHEGHEGFNRRLYKNNKDVMKSARKVAAQAQIFEKQLKQK